MVSGNKKIVTVIVDKTKKEKGKEGRLCDWQVPSKGSIEAEKQSYEFDLKSLSEYVDAGENPIRDIFNKKNKVVIVNWDVLNGDILYDSDKAFHIFQHYIRYIDIWVRHGGVLLVECQEGSRRLRQEVYDLLGEELGHPIAIQEGSEAGKHVHVNKKDLENHPLLKEVDTDDYEVKNTGVASSRYPSNKSSEGMWSDEENARWSEKIYVGWFDGKRCHKDWETLIFAEGKQFGKERPVMLCRTVEGKTVDDKPGAIGAYIITSMFIGSSGWSKLMENIINFVGEPARSAHKLHFRRRVAERKQRMLLIGTFILGAASLAVVCIFYPGQLGALFGAAIIGLSGFVYRKVKGRFEPTI